MNDMDDMQALRSIGLTPTQSQALWMTPHAPRERPMRVVEVQRGGVLTLHDGREARGGRARPALVATLHADDAVQCLAVGDWVWAEPDEGGLWWACALVPRQSALTRRTNDGDGGLRRQTLVANVDLALLVMGLDHDFNLRRLERYLALARLAGVDAVVALTKADLLAPAVVERRLRDTRAVLPPGTPAFAVVGPSPDSAAALAPHLQAGRTVVLLGSSGAGKSTLTNTLCHAAVQSTGGVRADDGRGRHTTTARTLHRSPQGACIIDTPGLRALRLDPQGADALGAVFDDIAEASLRCRFRDCRHQDEPGCAVRASVSGERLRNFQKLQREARRDAMTALEKRDQLGVWKARSRVAAAREREKRG